MSTISNHWHLLSGKYERKHPISATVLTIFLKAPISSPALNYILQDLRRSGWSSPSSTYCGSHWLLLPFQSCLKVGFVANEEWDDYTYRYDHQQHQQHLSKFDSMEVAKTFFNQSGSIGLRKQWFIIERFHCPASRGAPPSKANTLTFR